MAERIHAFLNAGGVVRKPPHDANDIATWIQQAEEDFAEFQRLKALNPLDPALQDPEAETALDYLRRALRHQTCLVAIHDGEVVGALAFTIRPGKHVFVDLVGSLGDPAGTGTALEYAIAELAMDLGLGTEGRYLETSKAFHQSIGRRLDVGLVKTTSIWTLEDCKVICPGIKKRL